MSLVLEPLPELYEPSSCVAASKEGSGAAAQGSSKCPPPAPCQQPRHAQGTAQQEPVDNSKATSPRYPFFFFPHDKTVVCFAVHTEFFSGGSTLVSYGMLDLCKHTFCMKSRILGVSKVTGTISFLTKICFLG